MAAPEESNWTEALVRFLREQPEVRAVRVNPATHRVAIATLNQIDLTDLEQKLAATISAVQARMVDSELSIWWK